MAFIIAFIIKPSVTKSSLLITIIKEEILTCITIVKQDSSVIKFKLITLLKAKITKVIVALVIIIMVFVIAVAFVIAVEFLNLG